MRTPALQPPPPVPLKRAPVLPSPAEVTRLLGACAPPERPESLREFLVRWLHQEV